MKLSQMHGQLLLESFQLSEATGAGEDIFRLLEVIESTGVDFILVGGHSISTYTGAPRATKDVDIVAKDWQTIVKAVQKAFPDVQMLRLPVAVRLMRPNPAAPDDPEQNREFLDIIRPHGGNAYYANVFDDPMTIDYGRSKLRVPKLEAALGAKFAAMLSPYRAEHKIFQDIADFIHMVKKNPEIDMKLLYKLGEKVYQGGGKEITDKVEDIRAGRRFSLHPD